MHRELQILYWRFLNKPRTSSMGFVKCLSLYGMLRRWWRRTADLENSVVGCTSDIGRFSLKVRFYIDKDYQTSCGYPIHCLLP